MHRSTNIGVVKNRPRPTMAAGSIRWTWSRALPAIRGGGCVS